MCGIVQTGAAAARTLSLGTMHRTLFAPIFDPEKEDCAMNLNLSIGPLVSLIAGVLILVMPRLLNYIVAIYLIVIGLLGLFGGSFHLK
jgi:hypothetical protein